MQLFYLSRNQDGYFKVRFVDQTTGKLLSAKSTHSKDKFEATMIATKWLEIRKQEQLFVHLNFCFNIRKISKNESVVF